MSWTWLALMVTAWLTDACYFPDFLQNVNMSQPWYSHIRHDRSWSKVTVVQDNSLSIKDTLSGTTEEWNCTVALHNKYLVQQDQGTSDMVFACVKIYKRSRSIVQLAWSSTSHKLDPDYLCAETSLVPDPWLLVAYHILEDDFSPCSVSGGFNMKIKDSSGQDNPCNLMDLPMRLESDCLAGEGVIFDFRSSNCRPDVAMHQPQGTVCVASWSDHNNHFTVLRRHNDQDLWCLRVPRKERPVLHGMLFSDLACHDGDVPLTTKHLQLLLERVMYSNLCMNEYPECADMPCNSYTQKQCMKTCRACDTRRPPAICSFPREFRGTYSLVDRDGVKDVEISESELSVESVGKFQCSMFPGSPISVMGGYYTTVSLSENGCRPRYSCVQIKRLGPSVLAYSLSQSIIWPTIDPKLGSTICNNIQFAADSEPISDLFRSHHDTQKAVIAQYPQPVRVDCNLTSAFTIQATFPNGDTCPGSLYEDCKERSRLRMDFSECRTAHLTNEFKCVAVFEGQYWEKIVLVQNTRDENDARCIVFNHLRKKEALMLRAGECDKLSWRFAKNSVRDTLVTLQIRQDVYPCKTLPKVERTTSALRIKGPYDSRSEDGPRSRLVTVDPSPQVVTPRQPPSRPQTEDSYHHVNSVHSGTGGMSGLQSVASHIMLLLSRYILS